MVRGSAEKMIKEQIEKSIIHDRDIREPLFDYLEELFQRDYTMIEETLNEYRKEATAKKRRRRR